MRLSFCAALLASATWLSGGEAVPFISLTVPDVARSAERLASSPYGKIWDLPQMQQVRRGLAKLPQLDPAWMACADRIAELRLQFTLPTGRGVNPDVVAAMRVPPGKDPKPPEDAQLRREGDWLLLGGAGQKLSLPPPTAGAASADLRLIMDFTALPAAMDGDDVKTCRAVLAALGLTRIEVAASASAEGSSEEITMPGIRLPLAPVAAAALVGFPTKGVGISAVGIDGPALVKLVHALATASGAEAQLAKMDREMRPMLGLGMDEVLAGLGGTWALATTTGVPFPVFTVSAPATPAVDALVKLLAERMQPGEGAQIVAQASTQVALLPPQRGMPFMVSVRRERGRWVISNDQNQIESITGSAAVPFAVETLWPKSAGAVFLSYDDSRAQLQMILGYLPMGLAQIPNPEVRRWVGLIQSALVAALPKLPISSMQGRMEGGLRVRGRNGLATDIMPISVMAGMLLPAISMTRESARRAHASNNMRQIVLGLITYSSESDGRWPADLAELKAWSDGDFTDKLFQSPGHPEIANPFLYVRPSPRAKATQPVLVQDPACNRGKGSVVCYADGHVGFVTGTALWLEAKRLAALPKAAAKDEGIERDDWLVETEAAAPAKPAVSSPGLF